MSAAREVLKASRVGTHESLAVFGAGGESGVSSMQADAETPGRRSDVHLAVISMGSDWDICTNRYSSVLICERSK